MSRIVLAMSGGVDSSVAAYLLKQAGHEVIGVFMRHGETFEPAAAAGGQPAGDVTHCGPGGVCAQPVPSATDTPGHAEPSDPAGHAEPSGSAGHAGGGACGPRLDVLQPLPFALPHKQGCCSASDAEDARRVADRLDVPFYALDFQDAFGRIVDYFVDEYASARTPNPCVMCNNWIKFGRLFDYADSIGAAAVATGHYARLEPRGDGPPALCRGLDATKDQSYVLFGLDRELLSRVMFPVGGYRKQEIRRLAGEIGLRVADKRDSQEICFVASGKHAEFVRRRLSDPDDAAPVDRSGDIVTTDGLVVGRHDGVERFTIGQRKGLGIALGEPHFVVRLDAVTRQVVIGRKQQLARTHLTADRANWLVDPPAEPIRCQAKIRYNTPSQPAVVRALDGDRIEVTFDEPTFGVAPGQAVVAYDGPRVLGGGWIE